MFIGVEPAALSYLTMQIDLTHSYLSSFNATVGHLLPWNSYTYAEYYVH